MPKIRRAISGPSSGLLTQVKLPAGWRARRRLGRGGHRGHARYYDPMLAKIIARGATRELAIANLAARARAGAHRRHRDQPALPGLDARTPGVRRRRADHRAAGEPCTRRRPSIEVLAAGTLTTVQDWPGRLGLWDVGVPPSGPMDALALRLANRMVGNDEGAAALEMTVTGATLRFDADAVIALAGAAHGRDARWRRRAVLATACRCSAAACSRSARFAAPASAPISRCAAASTFPNTSAAAPRSRSDSSAATAAARCAPATCCG